MNYMPYCQMMGYYMGSLPMMQYPVESFQDMYPEIYHRIYPKIANMCAMMDTPDNAEMYPCPSRAVVDRMVDDIYRSTVMEMGGTGDLEVREEDDNRQITPFMGGAYGYAPFYGYGFGGRRLLRDIIQILLLRELFRRRGLFHY